MRNLYLLAASALFSPLASPAVQAPSVLIRSSQLLPGGAPGERVFAPTAVAHGPDGEWVVQMITTDPEPGTSKLWGGPAGSPSGQIRREEQTYGVLDQSAFDPGVAVSGASLAYLPCVGTIGSGTCGRELWVDDTPIAIAGASSPLPQWNWGRFYSQLTLSSTAEPAFRAEIISGNVQRYGLFRGSPPAAILAPGDVIAGLPAPITNVQGTGTDFSPSGSHWIATVLFPCPGCGTGNSSAESVVVDGSVPMADGVPLTAGELVPASLGGMNDERYESFSAASINDAGSYVIQAVVRGNAGVPRRLLIVDGDVIMKSGDALEGAEWFRAREAQILENGDVYHLAEISGPPPFTARQAVIANGRIVLTTGETIDWNGDGVRDAGYTLFFIDWQSQSGLSISGDGEILALATVGTPSGNLLTVALRTSYGQGTNYCTALPNSTGSAASMSALGSQLIQEEAFVVRASSVPLGSVGYFLVGDQRADVLFPGGSSGRLCVGGSIGRFLGPGQVQAASPAGQMEIDVDLGAIPRPTQSVAVMAGDTWRFTVWFRDSLQGVPTSQFADGLEVTFD